MYRFVAGFELNFFSISEKHCFDGSSHAVHRGASAFHSCYVKNNSYRWRGKRQ